MERPTWHILLVMKHDPYTDCILWLPICLNTLNTDFFLILFFFKEHDDSSGTLLTQARGGRRGGRARHQQRDAKGSSPSPAPGEKSLKARSPSRTGLASSWHWSPPTPPRCGASLPLHQAGILPHRNRVPGTAPRQAHGPAPCPSIPSAAASLPCSLFNSFYFKPRAGAALAAAAGGDGTGTQRAGTKDTRPAAPSSGEMPPRGSSRSFLPAFPKRPREGGYSFSRPVAKATWLARQKSSRFQGKQPRLKQPCPEKRGLGALPSAPTMPSCAFQDGARPPFKTHPL